MPNLRTVIEEALKPLLPSSWQIIPYETEIDVPTNPVLMLNHKVILPDVGAGYKRLRHEIHLILISPKTSLKAAEDALDDDMETLFGVLSTNLDNLRFVKADKGIFQQQWACWDVEVEVSADLNTPTPVEE